MHNVYFVMYSFIFMRDSEISESADPLRVLQKTKEKQNEELILLTLTVMINRRDRRKDSIVVTET